MSDWILLLRGINVGGRNVLRMKDLVEILESFGLTDVQTYIQSGNAVFRLSGDDPPQLEHDIADAVEKRFGFRPHVLVISSEKLRGAIASNPFPEAEAEPKTLHFFFLSEPSKVPDLTQLAELKSPTEQYHLTEHVFYLHAPDGIGRSKLAAKVEKCLRVPVTARNWRTVRKISAMLVSD